MSYENRLYYGRCMVACVSSALPLSEDATKREALANLRRYPDRYKVKDMSALDTDLAIRHAELHVQAVAVAA